MPRCVDFCPLARNDGFIKSLSTGKVYAATTTAFPVPLEINFRRDSLVRNQIHLEPVIPLPDKPVPASSEAVCGLPQKLRERARNGGAGQSEVSTCPHHSKSFMVFSARAQSMPENPETHS